MAIHVVAGDGVVRIAVCDRGVGIPPDVRDRVFEPFFTTRTNGTGLGLAIVKRFVELQDGTVALIDRPGGGTIVELSLPLAAARTVGSQRRIVAGARQSARRWPPAQRLHERCRAAAPAGPGARASGAGAYTTLFTCGGSVSTRADVRHSAWNVTEPMRGPQAGSPCSAITTSPA